MSIANYLLKRKFQINLKVCLLGLFIFSWAAMLTAQTKVPVHGKVVDQTGKPVAFASVKVKGTTTGASANETGVFELSVSPGSTLVVSAVGYTAKEVTVHANENDITVTLAQTTSELDQVVVIGYGTQRKEAVTGSVASIQGSAIRDVPIGNITNALQGRLPGVVMTQTNSQPGQNMQIRIRGTRSLSATNDPLVVLDGIPYPGNIGDINPDDIRSIDILKDASATAIYGSRGANGVIMITTNKGAAGRQARVTYDGYVGIETLYHRYPMMNGDQLAKLRVVSKKYTATDAQGNVSASLGADEIAGTNTDWQKLMYKDGLITNHNISVAGGAEKTTYSFGAGYYKQGSLLPDQDYGRYSLRGSIDQQIGRYIRLGFTTNDNYSITNGQNLSLVNALLLSPLIDPYNADGTWKTRASSVADNNNYLYSRNAIKGLGNAYADKQDGFGSYNSLYGEVKIPGVNGLSYRINVGLNYNAVNRGQYQGVGVFNSSATAMSTASQQKDQTTNWTLENLLIYDKRWGKHHLNATGLYSSEQTQYTRSLVSAVNIPADFLQYYNLGQAQSLDPTNITIDPSKQIYQLYALQSLMGRVMYDYDNKYMLSVSFRADGSSRLATGHKWHSYPAISAGWNISKEDFMQDARWLNNLKLRVGYGQTSNQSVSPYATLGALSSSYYNFGSAYAVGYYVSSLPNSTLGWEYSNTWNAGIDFGFFQNRLTGSIDYYNVHTNDILYNVPLPTTNGVSNRWENVGKTKNNGIEVALNGVIISNRNGWTWELGVNFAANKNELTALSSGVSQDVNNWWFVGHPINVIYDYQKVGIWQQNDPYLNILEPGGNVGMIKVKYAGTYNTDGSPTRQIGPDDRQIMKVDPTWQGGFNTRLAYKNLDLTILGQYQHGGILISNLESSYGYLNILTGRRGQVNVNYWTPDNTGGTYPLPGGITSGDNPKYGSTLGYFNASYFKISTITLGYNFNKQAKWVKDLGVQGARVYFAVQNAFVLFSPFAKETGLDPVANSFVNQNAAVTTGWGNNNLLSVGSNTPQMRNFIFGLNFSF